jgi:hypothetical protein
MSSHPLSHIETETTPLSRFIKCPHCREVFHLPRRNALAIAAKLRGILRKHINEAHPEVTS